MNFNINFLWQFSFYIMMAKQVGIILLFSVTGSVSHQCQICGDSSIGFYWGAYVCEACKKFYARVSRQSNLNYRCSDKARLGVIGRCDISRLTRTSCPYCRYQKCLTIGMELPGKIIGFCIWETLCLNTCYIHHVLSVVQSSELCGRSRQPSQPKSNPF